MTNISLQFCISYKPALNILLCTSKSCELIQIYFKEEKDIKVPVMSQILDRLTMNFTVLLFLYKFTTPTSCRAVQQKSVHIE